MEVFHRSLYLFLQHVFGIYLAHPRLLQLQRISHKESSEATLTPRLIQFQVRCSLQIKNGPNDH